MLDKTAKIVSMAGGGLVVLSFIASGLGWWINLKIDEVHRDVETLQISFDPFACRSLLRDHVLLQKAEAQSLYMKQIDLRNSISVIDKLKRQRKLTEDEKYLRNDYQNKLDVLPKAIFHTESLQQSLNNDYDSCEER